MIDDFNVKEPTEIISGNFRQSKLQRNRAIWYILPSKAPEAERKEGHQKGTEED